MRFPTKLSSNKEHVIVDFDLCWQTLEFGVHNQVFILGFLRLK